MGLSYTSLGALMVRRAVVLAQMDQLRKELAELDKLIEEAQGG